MKIPIKEILKEKHIDSLIKSRWGPQILCEWENTNIKNHIVLPKYAHIYHKSYEFILSNFLDAGEKEGLKEREAFALLYNYFFAPLHLNFETNEEGCKKITNIMQETTNGVLRRKELFSLMCKYSPNTKSLYSEAKKAGFEKEPLVWKSKFFDFIDKTKSPVYMDELDIIGAQDCVGCIAHEVYHRKSNNWINSKHSNAELYEGITEWLAMKYMPSDRRFEHVGGLDKQVKLAGYLSYVMNGDSKLEKVYLLGAEATEKAIFEATGIKLKENEKASDILNRILKKQPEDPKLMRWESYVNSSLLA